MIFESIIKGFIFIIRRFHQMRKSVVWIVFFGQMHPSLEFDGQRVDGMGSVLSTILVA